LVDVRVVVVGLIATAFTFVACRPKKDPTAEEACRRIEPLRSPTVDGGWTDDDRHRCLEQWRVLGAAARACAARCLNSSKSPRDYDECLDDCAGNQLSPLGICMRTAPDGSSADSDCITRLTEVQQRRPAAYTCVSRCARRSTSIEEARACENTCGLR
jgi:hypothetical protein